MIDPRKVVAKLDELGEGWISAEGFHVLRGVNGRNKEGEIKLDDARIFMAKLFVNTETGETKLFLATDFEM